MAQAKTPKFARTRLVTVPTLKLVNDTPLYLKIETPMTTSTNSRKQSDGTLEKPATVMRVINLTTGEPAQVVVPEVLKSNLSTHYPNDSYVGKSFEILAHAPAQGKRYRAVEIYEIDPNSGE